MTLLAMALDLVLGGIAVVGLWGGATWFVRGATRAARRLGVPGLVIGLTVVAFGTSAPEFAVTVEALLAGQTDISVANVVGSNLVNLGFVLGGAALVTTLPTSRDLVVRDGSMLVGTTALVLVLLWDLRLARWEGALLAALLVTYLAVLARIGSERVRVEVDDRNAFRRTDLFRLVAGLVLVVVSGRLLVLSAADLARAAGVSEWAIGATVVAMGTSAPEFATSVVALRGGRAGLSAGNIVGSCIFNALGVLGVAGLLGPLAVATSARVTTGALLLVTVLVVVTFYTGSALSRREGGVLVGANVVAWVLDFLA